MSTPQDSTLMGLGINLLEHEVDDVIFTANEFITDQTFTGQDGPFWYILQSAVALAAMFAIIMGANIGYKIMLKKESFDVMKCFRPLAIGLVLGTWYPQGDNWGILSFLAYVPNCIGSYTHDLYMAEADNLAQSYENVQNLIAQRDEKYSDFASDIMTASDGIKKTSSEGNAIQTDDTETEKSTNKLNIMSMITGAAIMIDKVIMVISLIVFRVGWWSTIFCQQIILAMLTIFGPFQWAFSMLPKWESAWAKWITRYLTVHFYGAMLFFVGFYVVLLFDIVLNMQMEGLKAILASNATFTQYAQHIFFSAGYLMVASIVALKALNLVPDLASWMIPEGDTAFSTRNFGEGVAAQSRASISSVATRGLL